MTSFLSNLGQTNISYYLIPVAWFVAISPRGYSAALYQSKTKKKFDSRAPRDFIGTVTSHPALDTATKRRLQRAEAAQANGFENLGLFAAAVVAGNVAKLDPTFLNAITLVYVASRVVYNYIYIINDTPSLAAARSSIFLFGLGTIMALFVKAGNNLQSLVL